MHQLPTAALILTLLWTSTLADPIAAGELRPVADSINNGLLTSAHPAVALFFTGTGTCSATLIGCQTALTAAHCVCDDGPCSSPTAGKLLFFQNSGGYGVSSIAVHPGWTPDVGLGRHDLAILHLASPVAGVQPSPLAASKPALGTTATLVGFGRTPTTPSGLKRQGQVQLSSCADSNPGNLCYDFVDPIGAPGLDSTACPGDSGGPMFGTNAVVAGVTSGGLGPGADDCTSPVQGVYSDVFTDRAWIQSQAGTDLGQAACGGLPNAGTSLAPAAAGTGFLSPAQPSASFTFEVPANTAFLHTFLNAEDYLFNDFDLYVKFGSPASSASFDCKSELEGSLEQCVITNPAAGAWHLNASHFSGAGVFQLTATAYGSAPAEPPPPASGVINSPQYPNFRFWVRISDTRIGTPVAGCLPETLCVAGAIPTRAEVFIRIVGPKANGYLWPNIIKFNTTKTEVWIQQISTSDTQYYFLPALATDSATLPGLVDKVGFLP